MENKVLKKIIIFVTVFMLVFSNCGYTLQALAATDGITLFGFNLFGSGNIDFDVYFLDENGKKQTEEIQNVNSEMTMVLEISPKAEGYLKSGTVKAVSEEEGDINFKFENAYIERNSDNSDLVVSKPADTTLLQTETMVDLDKIELENESQDKLKDGTLSSDVNERGESNVVSDENIVSENTIISQNIVEDNTIDNQNTISVENTVNNEIIEQVDEETSVENIDETEELVNEDIVLEEETEKQPLISSELAKATVVNDDKIEVENIIENTKIYANISFKTGENLNIKDLYKKIKLEFEGTYINTDLEELPISLSEDLKVGWEYSKDVDVSAEYTKVSPFRIGETKGTILESTITLKRDVTEDNYLPLKETDISLEIPNINGKVPTELNVKALKLKATNGQDVNEVTFSNENWEYDSNKNTLNINVKNEEGKFTYGEDIYVVTLRYDTYVEESEISLQTKGTVKVTEFSGKNNNEIIKDLNNVEKVVANVGELITYSIATTDEKIAKSKINANYNSQEEKYESEFETTVSVNILTNDVLNEFVLKDTKEFYIDKEGLEFESNDVKYKNIKFRYDEIKDLLENGGTIEIKNSNGDLLYILNKDLIKSDEDTEIAIEGDVRGIEISFKNITTNGNINIEFIKAIGKSSYEKAAFANFKKLASKINAVVKYSEDSKETALDQIKIEKEFEESNTTAEITMNRVNLSTTEINENVEFKIELNNDKEDSDLYINPVFEIALPKYVSNIDIKGANILYAAGLLIGNTTIYRAEDGTQRIRMEVNGTETEFSGGTITNGTNIIINTNIELDQYAPRKDEQVKLYYINEGVTNYSSQTKWTIEKDIPTGILKTTNGFDSYAFKINAPSGFVTVNEIQNYDGQDSKVSSMRQGIETREVEMGKTAQVARMNLIAINNTENKCTDVAFLGRIPMKGVTDVKTGEKLETNVNATMISRIAENEGNPLSAKIYYSSNPNADKNLSDSSNGWTEEFSGISDIKSFLIVPDNTVEPGYIFRYSYEYIIPENLPYEAKIYGSFGAFYNNHSETAITYEASSADLVGVVTKAGPKVEATLSVDIGNGNPIQVGKKMKYTVTVVNSGSMVADNITIKAPIPENTVYISANNGTSYGDLGFAEEPNKKEINFGIETLNPGEVKEFTYYVRTKEIEDSKSVKTYITNKVEVNVPLLAKEITTNEVKNELKSANFLMKTSIDHYRDLIAGMKTSFGLKLKNVSGKDLKDVKIVFDVGEIYNYESSYIYDVNFDDDSTSIADFDFAYESGEINGKEGKATFDSSEGKIYLDVGNLSRNESKGVIVKVIAKNTNSGKENFNCQFEVEANGIEKELSEAIPQSVIKSYLEAEDISVNIPKEINENESFTVSTKITNIGKKNCTNGKFEYEVSDALEIEEVVCSNGIKLPVNSETDKISEKLPVIASNESITVDMKLKAKNEPGVDSTKATVERIVCNSNQDNINIDKIDLTILNSEKTEDELEEERIEKLKQLEEQNNPNTANEENQYENDNNSQSVENNSGVNNKNSKNNSQNSNVNDEKNNNSEHKQNQLNENKEKVNNEIQNNSESQSQEKLTFSINGKAWLDENKNGRKDDEEQAISGIKAFLLKSESDTMIKSTIVGRDGSYSFSSIENGKYIVAFDFDKDKYNLTAYKKSDVEEDRNSDVIDSNSNDISAITNEITVDNSNVDNIDIGLQNKDVFDLQISKYISAIKVSTKKGDKTYKYKNQDLAKVEIPSRYIDGAKVELEYKVIVKNTGSIAGYAEQIVDYLNNDLEFDESRNNSWYKGNDGYIYVKDLNQVILQPGETREVNLILTKTMNEENTGVISNKVSILNTYSQSGEKENDNGNSSIQNTLVSISTGKAARNIMITFNLILIICICAAIYYKKTGKLILKIRLKRFYK